MPGGAPSHDGRIGLRTIPENHLDFWEFAGPAAEKWTCSEVDGIL
jgi:hypothetical protein